MLTTTPTSPTNRMTTVRFDVVSVFPSYLRALQLSLVGKAHEAGLIDLQVHNLRDWTEDRHRTVDDTPAGGGAGMVMRPDIWGDALDDVLDAPVEARDGGTPQRVLAIPTPSGFPLTQALCQELANQADQIVIACGRYEGIDSRVATHFAGRDDVELLEFSLGDYVLNGGEVAALAMVEAVARLVPGVVGNPQSLVEESHGEAGLLEYPVYTRPMQWAGHAVPQILLSGDHGRIARWRRDAAIDRTAERRPDMIAALDATTLDRHDRSTLSRWGWYWPLKPVSGDRPQRPTVDIPTITGHASLDEAQIADYVQLARMTFPDACPASLDRRDIDAFIAENLTAEKFREYIESPEWILLGIRMGGELVGYSLSLVPSDDGVAGMEEGAPASAALDSGPRDGPLIELSKFYVARPWRGSRIAGMLMASTLRELASVTVPWERPYVWLGTNRENHRARKLYEKLGFAVVGKRIFLVGDQNNDDIVMARALDVAY